MSEDKMPWVVLQYDVQPPELRCKRCGSREVVNLPMSISFLTGWMREWSKRHKDCEPSEEQPIRTEPGQ